MYTIGRESEIKVFAQHVDAMVQTAVYQPYSSFIRYTQLRMLNSLFVACRRPRAQKAASVRW